MPFSDPYHVVENQKADLMVKRKNTKNRGKGVKSGLEDENSKSLKIDENHIEYREKYGDRRYRGILGSKGPGRPLEII